MAAPSPPSADYFNTKRSPAYRTRPSAQVISERQRNATPGSPRTPLLGRSISSHFGSPGSFRVEQEDYVVYELGARHLSAGFAGESRPRCIVRFGPEMARRVGDYREYDPTFAPSRRKGARRKPWGEDYEFYRTDIRGLDLGLVEGKLERVVRHIHSEYLQLDPKPKKVVLAIPSLLPTPLLKIALKVLFNHYTQPPSAMILTTPILACVGAGLRHALVVDVGWEETVVTAVGEYKEVFQRRSVRAGKMLTQETSTMLQEEMKKQGQPEDVRVDFRHAEDVVERMAWCRPRPTSSEVDGAKRIPLPDCHSKPIPVPINKLAEPAENVLFASHSTSDDLDDHDLPLHHLVYRVLLALPLDLRALCISRLVITGGVSNIPGLKPRLLSEIHARVEERGWDAVSSYGSASAHHSRVLRERDNNAAMLRQKPPDQEAPPLSPTKNPIQDSLPPSQREVDAVKDPISVRIERKLAANASEPDVKSVVRGVETLGVWAGASLLASLRVKGVHEVEREEFLKFGLKAGPAVF